MREDLAGQAARYAAEVRDLRERFERAKKTGVLPEDIKEKAVQLSAQLNRLLVQALPVYRSRHLDDPGLPAALTPVLRDLKDLAESDLPAHEKQLIGELALAEGWPELPDIPDADGFDAGRYNGETFYGCVRGDVSAFVFGDEGDVLLFEKNQDRWQCREQPVLTSCFADGAVMESDSACLIKNLDGGVDRISYSRMDSAGKLAKAPLF